VRARQIEFWPDYGGVLLHEGGSPVDLAALPLPTSVIQAATRWVAGYSDARLDPGAPDLAWIAEGRVLHATIRDQLAPFGIQIVDWEGTWSPDEGAAGDIPRH
jgi:hypothetical protein